MRLYIGPRAAGKTTELISLCEEMPGTVIVATNKAAAENIGWMAMALGKTIPEPITFKEFVDRKWVGRKITGFIFDDLDRALQIMAGSREVLAASITEERTVWQGRRYT